jgi:Cu/Ag efflux protein CusF
MKNLKFAMLITSMLLLPPSSPAFAADSDHGAHHTAQAPGQTHTGKGVVKWVDADSGEIDLRHEPMPSLKWPAMTMSFKAQDAALLKGIKEKDVVEFDLMKKGNEYEIVRIRKAD